VNFKDQLTSRSVLRDILARNPKASLQEIRHSPPVLREMSMDHLSLRVSQTIDDQRGDWLK
jgi:hypothetical protein